MRLEASQVAPASDVLEARTYTNGNRPSSAKYAVGYGLCTNKMPADKLESVAVVGAGAWGLSTALHLIDAGYSNVTVFDQASEIPSQYSGAYDLNKIVRAEYEDDFYTELALVSKVIGCLTRPCPWLARSKNEG